MPSSSVRVGFDGGEERLASLFGWGKGEAGEKKTKPKTKYGVSAKAAK